MQYYHIKNKGDHTGTYIPARDREVAVQLAQKDYDKKVVESSTKEIKFLSKVLKDCAQFFKKNTLAEKIFQKLHKNRRARKEFLWEHFGRMDNTEYATQTVSKLNLFASNGIFPGKNLIITMETSSQPLNTHQIKKLAEEFLI